MDGEGLGLEVVRRGEVLLASAAPRALSRGYGRFVREHLCWLGLEDNIVLSYIPLLQPA